MHNLRNGIKFIKEYYEFLIDTNKVIRLESEVLFFY